MYSANFQQIFNKLNGPREELAFYSYPCLEQQTKKINKKNCLIIQNIKNFETC